jgi:hypothetical protein
MLARTSRPWLALATFLALVGACEINPQPGLPSDHGGTDGISTGTGGSQSGPSLGEEEPGAAGDRSAGGAGGLAPEQEPPEGGRSSEGGAGAGAEFTGGDGGEPAGPGAGGKAG